MVIGTPPDTHYNILKKILKGNPRAVLIEKPLCRPTNKEINFFKNHLLNYKIKFFCGYNHTIGKAALKIRKLLQKKDVGKIISIDVDWREHWQGIFKAHPWLNGPSDTYLGFWKRGGGALSEHSHGINIWQFLANSQSVSKIYSINSNISYKKLNKSNYDDIAFINLKSSNNIMGRVVQDVVTLPVKKSARILTQNAYLEWHCERSKGFDEVIYLDAKNENQVEETSSANIFVVKNNILKTPALKGSILEGVTRDSIITIAKHVHKLDVIEDIITVHDLINADEVFCTGTAVVVTPIGKINHNGKEKIICGNSIGPITNMLRKSLIQIQLQDVPDPFNGVKRLV